MHTESNIHGPLLLGEHHVIQQWAEIETFSNNKIEKIMPED
jgi:hypothetical protein